MNPTDLQAETSPAFGNRLADAVRRRGTPVMVGLDPRFEQLPETLRGSAITADPAVRAVAYRTFCRGVIDVVAPLVAVVKPQAAFFEELGPPGMEALADMITYAHQHDLLVVLDGKRNDIGSTAIAYAAGYLGPHSAWRADALTVSPYLGQDSLEPFAQVATERGAGIFVLVKTSNPGGGLLQDLVAAERTIYRHVADLVERMAQTTAGTSGYGCVGAVVGATYPQQLAELRTALPHAWLLVPGYGSQGAGAKDVAAAFDARGLGAVINNSRGIIFAHARPEYAKYGAARWQDAVAEATRSMIAELAGHTSAGKLRKGA